MKLGLQKFSYRFAEQVLNSRLVIKQEIEHILLDPNIDISKLSRPYFNEILRVAFLAKGWEDQPTVFNEPSDPSARLHHLLLSHLPVKQIKEKHLI